MQNKEEERPSVLEVELFQHPFVTVTSNKLVSEETTAEVTVQVKIENEESEIALQLPASKQTSSDIGSASSKEKKLTQNTYLLEFVSGEMKRVCSAETSVNTLVEQTVTVEANKVGIEKSKEIVSDPPKENPEKLQNESFLLGEHVETKESKAQNAVLKEDIALQKERKEIDAVVTERNVDPKKDNDFANECQLCQFDTETVTMIEQLVDQRPRKAQLLHPFLRHFQFSNISLDGVNLGGNRDLAAGIDIVNMVAAHNGSIRSVKVGSLERQASGEIKFTIEQDAIVWPRRYKQAEHYITCSRLLLGI
ncbi:UNVERIFIED_CONTAM: hypothetical protein K2H54_065145 [Gekko kuhli]